MSSLSEKFEIYLPVFVTDEHAFDHFQVNAIPFKIKEPEETLKYVFKKLIPDLSEKGIYAYPHHDKLYFVLRNKYDDISHLLAIMDEAVSGLTPYVDCDPNGISLINLSPTVDDSHFVVARAIVYSLIGGHVSFVPRNEGDSETKNERRRRRSFLLLIDVELVGNTKLENRDATIEVHRYLGPFLEVTARGRCRLWFDIKSKVYVRFADGKKIPLEQNKKLKSLGEELYKKCRERLTLKPAERLKIKVKAREILEEILRNLCYYVYDDSRHMFEERCYAFTLIQSNILSDLLHDQA